MGSSSQLGHEVGGGRAEKTPLWGTKAYIMPCARPSCSWLPLRLVTTTTIAVLPPLPILRSPGVTVCCLDLISTTTPHGSAGSQSDQQQLSSYGKRPSRSKSALKAASYGKG